MQKLLMANTSSLTPSLLKENIYLLTAGTFFGSICILLFDKRLYAVGDIFLLFILILTCFIVQAFVTSFKNFVAFPQLLLIYLQSFVIIFLFMLLLYGLLLPFDFHLVETVKFSLLLTAIQTNLGFFIKYRQQYLSNIEKEKRITQSVQQQKVKELEVLKQQIDPHFIFNSFNTLAFLIDENGDKAKMFSNKLANVHRYIIFNSNKNLVALTDEIVFARDYSYLQEIRFSNEVQISFTGFDHVENIFILPVSLQILLENAMKHNAFSESEPLRIQVSFAKNCVTVENNLHEKNYDSPSSKIGLTNLRNRCNLILGKELEVEKTPRSFIVKVPVLVQ